MGSAADAHYAKLLGAISASRKRTEDSKAAYQAGNRTYWYFVIDDYCPVCGKSSTTRERNYTPRPERWEDRHQMMEVYDWCDV